VVRDGFLEGRGAGESMMGWRGVSALLTSTPSAACLIGLDFEIKKSILELFVSYHSTILPRH